MPRWLLFSLAALCAASTLAQDPKNYSRFELYGGYLDSGEPQYNIFHYSGGIQLQSDFGTHHGLETSVIRNFNRYFGLKATSPPISMRTTARIRVRAKHSRAGPATPSPYCRR
jgi:hypothetical protein